MPGLLDIAGHDGAGADHASSQIVTGRIVAFEPIETRLPIVVDSPQIAVAPRRAAALEAVVDEHHAVADEAILADRHQLADEAWHWTRVRAPIRTPRWISTNGPTKQSSPIVQP